MPWSKATVTYERGRGGHLGTMTGEVEVQVNEALAERGGFIRVRDEAHPGRMRYIPTKAIVVVDIVEGE